MRKGDYIRIIDDPSDEDLQRDLHLNYLSLRYLYQIKKIIGKILIVASPYGNEKVIRKCYCAKETIYERKRSSRSKRNKRVRKR